MRKIRVKAAYQGLTVSKCLGVYFHLDLSVLKDVAMCVCGGGIVFCCFIFDTASKTELKCQEICIELWLVNNIKCKFYHLHIITCSLVQKPR